MTDDGEPGPAPERASFARYREIMAAHGFRPSKRLGQNFLLDPSLHRAIADAAELSRTEVALEVGPGLGFLTRELAQRAARVVAVELDKRLADILEQELAAHRNAFGPNTAPVDLVRSDALEAGGRLSSSLVAAVEHARSVCDDARLAVIANLPYAVSGRFLAALLDGATPAVTTALDRVVVVVQLELAERLAASPGSKQYGGLSVLAQACGEVEVLRRIGREVFRPRPNVDSALLRIRVSRAAPAGFAEWIRVLFQSRRKTLRYALRQMLSDEDLGASDVEGWLGRRAEQCGVDELLELFRIVSERSAA